MTLAARARSRGAVWPRLWITHSRRTDGVDDPVDLDVVPLVGIRDRQVQHGGVGASDVDEHHGDRLAARREALGLEREVEPRNPGGAPADGHLLAALLLLAVGTR